MLKSEGALALKPVSGSLGDGFYKLSFINDDYYINSNIVEEQDLNDFLMKLDEYILTEYIYAHTEIRKISDFGLNTLRLMIINENQKQPIIANAFMRFGTEKTGPVDNAAAGGIFTIVNIESGEYSNPKRVEGFTLINCPIHPDTDKKIAGILPNWELIKDKVIEISKYLSEITYMGFDVAITDNGFKIIEINSHQVVRRYQSYYPLLVDNEASPFFNKLLSRK